MVSQRVGPEAHPTQYHTTDLMMVSYVLIFWDGPWFYCQIMYFRFWFKRYGSYTLSHMGDFRKHFAANLPLFYYNIDFLSLTQSSLEMEKWSPFST